MYIEVHVYVEIREIRGIVIYVHRGTCICGD